MWSINEFCEPLDHEFPDAPPLAGFNGVRLDEDWGVKQFCGMQALKSTDFLVLLKGKHAFLEFSDIGLQIDSTLQKVKALKESNVSDQLTKELGKKLRKAVSQEARDKYKDTCTLFSRITDYQNEKLSDSPLLAKGCKFIIVYAPFRKELQNSPADLVRFIDHMQNNLATSIPDEMFHQVEIITLDAFRNRYE